MPAPPKGKRAFAFGGLGGFNAHGVGFLEAARELDVRPSIITCTSGMIDWVARWLDGEELLPLLRQQIQRSNKFPVPLDWMNSLWISWFGDPGIFRPAVPEYWRRWMTPFAPDGAQAGDEQHRRKLAKAFLDRMFPAQLYVPQRGRADVERIARAMNRSEIPVVFNSFHPATGLGYLHVNEAGRDFLGVEYGEAGGGDKYLPIDADAVTAALWLYFYGFEHADNPRGLVDGAYNRQFIIRELYMVDRIYAVRPINTRWIGTLPANYFEIQDFTTELWFNSAYAAETGQMALINRLIDEGKLLDDRFRRVDLTEIQVERQYGYFDFFVEEMAVYERSHRQSLETLREKEGVAVAELVEMA
ncbi:hypothetical protein [Arenibaculum sp.]|jgi:hypothetical protein|uniref:hypothetical protein n=1 Tax=Arenibaculum sp. TaxID=2865862 RepID=UPI002E0E5202|nr:hypothetical protein [Arenibaculum sp.]